MPAFEHSATPPIESARGVTIVAGLPRSGTSMMMQLLAAAGIAPYTDRQRVADTDNPRGYFEHENAARLRICCPTCPPAKNTGSCSCTAT
jgi:hypothetical protein